MRHVEVRINNYHLLLLLIGYSAGMAFGQVLFKLAATTIQDWGPNPPALAYLNVFLITALVLYTGLSVLWVWLLRFVPLSKAYPFVALAFVFTPLLAHVFFREELSFTYFVGLAFILLGISIVSLH